MEIISQILLIAVLIEACVDWVKNFINNRFNYQQITALIAALIFAAGSGLNLFEIVGIAYKWPVVGIILTAIIISRGSNYVQDFFDLVNAWKKSNN